MVPQIASAAARVVLLALVLSLVALEASAEQFSSELCSNGLPPQWRWRGLPLCSRFERKTCCSRTDTDSLYALWAATQRANFKPECSAMFETVLCMACDPEVGLGKKRSICTSTCETWFEACKGEFFASMPVSKSSTASLVPCLDNALVCSKLEDFVPSGKALCANAGLSLSPDVCYDGSVDPSAFGVREDASGSSSSSSASTSAQERALLAFATWQRWIVKSAKLGASRFIALSPFTKGIALAGVFLILGMLANTLLWCRRTFSSSRKPRSLGYGAHLD